jgi:TonB family protein
LWRAGTEGVARVEFVVDTTGQAELQFFTVISSPAPEFSAAVREALADAHFTPAMKGGRIVRQLVQLPVRFTVPRRAPSESLSTHAAH